MVRGLALRSWRQFFASFAVKKNLTAKNAKDSQRTQSKSFGKGRTELGALFGFAFLAAGLCDLCGKEELNREEGQGFAKEQSESSSQGGEMSLPTFGMVSEGGELLADARIRSPMLNAKC